MDPTRAMWIKDPLAILADGAERGIVVQDGRIVELVPRGGQPQTAAAFFEAGDHVVLPGLINTHHHFYQTLTRALPAALDRELFPWLQALYPIWAGLTPEALDLGMTLACLLYTSSAGGKPSWLKASIRSCRVAMRCWLALP